MRHYVACLDLLLLELERSGKIILAQRLYHRCLGFLDVVAKYFSTGFPSTGNWTRTDVHPTTASPASPIKAARFTDELKLIEERKAKKN